jgi:hypothetical protein
VTMHTITLDIRSAHIGLGLASMIVRPPTPDFSYIPQRKLAPNHRPVFGVDTS